jgi:oxalate---CoA ligase
MNSLSHVLTTLAYKSPDAAAIAAPGRADLSFQALFESISIAHRQLRALGVKRGDRVMLFAPGNSPETASLSLAIAASATAIIVNPDLSNSELSYYLEGLPPQAILAFPQQFDRLVEIAQQAGIPLIKVIVDVTAPAGTYHLDLLPAHNISGDISDWAIDRDIALITMTSGSTGTPKFVPITHAAICDSCAQASQLLQLSPDDICLNLLSLFHVHGSISNFLLPLLSGSKVAFYGDFNPKYFSDWLIESRATWYSVGPTLHLAILRAISQNLDRIAAHSLRFIRSGSSVLSPQTIAELERLLGVPLVQGYGMSELPLFTSTPFPPIEGNRGFIPICNSTKIAIMDEIGNCVPNGTVGEIFVSGENVMSGYIGSHEANANAFCDGWLQTGDLGWLDAAGYLHLAGRLKEIINRGGNKVSPQEVDNVLMQFSEVEEVGTFGISHPRLGEDVVAAVVLKQGKSITERTLRTLLFDRLTDFKVPSQIIFVEAIPKGKTGKIQRNVLANKFADRLQVTHATPRNELELKIADLFANVLDLDRVSIYDNFFLLGGDSLIGTQLVSRICQTFAVNIPLRSIFELPTVADFTSFIATWIETIAPQSNDFEYEEGQL